MKTQLVTPWLDQNGNLFSDDELKSISKKWTPEIWEKFLAATVEGEMSEHEVLTTKYESLCEQQTESNFSPPCNLPQGVQRDIQRAVNSLEERPQRIIRLHFWEEKSVREIGRTERLSWSHIQKTKKNSLSQIKDLLEKSVHTSSYLIGGSKNFDLPASRDEEIKAVYRADLEGSYLK